MDNFHQRWAAITPPLRPGPDVVAAIRSFIEGRPGYGLQLGVTPEIAHLTNYGVAIDVNKEMIRLAWPGDRETHKAIIGNWLAMPFKDASFDIAFGDGCLSMLKWPDEYFLFLQNLKRVVRPGGRLLLRCFAGSDDAEALESITEAAFAGSIHNFSAFKLRLNMAAFRTAAGAANTGSHIHHIFQNHFSDRARLSAATSWPLSEIASIDAYEGGHSLHTYPTRTEIAALLPASWRYRFVETEGYELAGRCPLLIVDFP